MKAVTVHHITWIPNVEQCVYLAIARGGVAHMSILFVISYIIVDLMLCFSMTQSNFVAMVYGQFITSLILVGATAIVLWRISDLMPVVERYIIGIQSLTLLFAWLTSTLVAYMEHLLYLRFFA